MLKRTQLTGPLEASDPSLDRQVGKVARWVQVELCKTCERTTSLGLQTATLRAVGRRISRVDPGLVFELVSHLAPLGDMKHLLPCATNASCWEPLFPLPTALDESP